MTNIKSKLGPIPAESPVATGATTTTMIAAALSLTGTLRGVVHNVVRDTFYNASEYVY